MVQDVNLKHDKTLRLPINAPAEIDMTLPVPEAHTTWEWDDTGTKLVKASSPAEATRRAESAAVSAESDKNQAVSSASAAAQSAKEAKAVAADMDAHVSGYKAEVETISSKLKSEYSNYSTTLKTQSDAAEKSLSGLQTTVESSIKTLQDSAISKVSATQTDVLSKIEAAHTSAISDIGTAKTNGLTAVSTAQKKATDTISAAQDTATTAITTEKTNAVNSITPLVTETQTNANAAKQSAQAAAASVTEAAQHQIQADYAETDTNAKSYIKNKPDVFLKTGGKITGNTEIEVPTEGTYNIPLKVQVPDLKDGEGVYLNLGKEGSTNNRFRFGFEYQSSGNTANAFSISAYSGAHYKFDSVGNAYIPGSLATTTLNAGKLNIDGNGVTTTNLIATGETSVPTANAGNKSKTIASTEFVQNAVAGIVDSAPDALNTLKELANALGNDANFSTTITTLIGEKESKADANVEYETLRQSIVTKQDKLTFDESPTAGSTNPVTSNGIKAAIDAKTVFNADGHLVFANGGELWVE